MQLIDAVRARQKSIWKRISNSSAIEKLQGMVQSDEWQAANEHGQRGLDATVAFPTQPDPS